MVANAGRAGGLAHQVGQVHHLTGIIEGAVLLQLGLDGDGVKRFVFGSQVTDGCIDKLMFLVVETIGTEYVGHYVVARTVNHERA